MGFSNIEVIGSSKDLGDALSRCRDSHAAKSKGGASVSDGVSKSSNEMESELESGSNSQIRDGIFTIITMWAHSLPKEAQDRLRMGDLSLLIRELSKFVDSEVQRSSGQG